MRTSSILRATCGLLLLCLISSFSGCDKLGDAKPRTAKSCKKTTTTASDTTSTGAN